MVKLNHHYQKLSSEFLFTELEQRVGKLKSKDPSTSFVNLGVGDFTTPLFPSVISAHIEATHELGDALRFRGYGPCEGYLFLREKIASHDYAGLGISPEEIFVSDGAGCDIANLQELFAVENKVAIPDPSYPVYLDSNIMAGRTRHQLKTGAHGNVVYLPCTEETNFLPHPPKTHADLIYLCSPHNPTGCAMPFDLLQQWVEYAQEHQAVILFDGAYEAYIQSKNVPHSIYAIPGAKEVSIEVRSYSKSAGFTGLRCSYTVVPRELRIHDVGATHSLRDLWKRRHDTKFNGVSYPVQKAAEALYTSQGQKEFKESVVSYSTRTRNFREELIQMGYRVYGGLDCPYIWCKTLAGMSSWEFFDYLLEKAHIITLPGKGFGLTGEGYVRLSGFAKPDQITEALKRLKELA